jgi:hypothetical protein
LAQPTRTTVPSGNMADSSRYLSMASWADAMILCDMIWHNMNTEENLYEYMYQYF